MNFFKRGPVEIAILVALIAGAANAQHASEEVPKTRVDVAGEIAKLREAWVKHWNAGELTSIIETYAPDAVILPPDGQRISGTEAIAKYWKRIKDQQAGTLSVQMLSSGFSGDLAYESGRLTRIVPGSPSKTGEIAVKGQPGTTHRIEGNYLVIFRRQPDGRWRIVEHAFTEALLKSMIEDKQPKPKPMMPESQER